LSTTSCFITSTIQYSGDRYRLRTFFSRSNALSRTRRGH
jgi:hypothetical protein